MTSTALTSELEAVNTILAAIDESPVSSLSLSGLYPLEQAKAALSEASRAVQSTGWAFNTEEGFSATKDGSGQITLAGNVLAFAPDASLTIDPVLRGSRLYDRKAHSYVFTANVTGTAVFLLGWDELPQAARHYITIRAAKTLQGRTSVPDSTYKYTQADLDEALLRLTAAEDADDRFNMLTDSWSVAGVIYDRDML